MSSYPDLVITIVTYTYDRIYVVAAKKDKANLHIIVCFFVRA